MKLARLATILLVMAPLPALAQTAEEAVAYAFLGVADGATLKRATTTMSWKETKTAPTTFEGDVNVGGRKAALRFISPSRGRSTSSPAIRASTAASR
jgi:hypothetical protein